MDLEQLTKHQIVLLTLLVSFVTSIATGIVTVALMNQAPASVTRTINQIVERTVETVAPATQGAATATVKTVIVKNDDLVAQSIAAVQKGMIRIVAKADPSSLVARGVIIDQHGTALTDRGALDANGAAEFQAILYSGELVPLKVRAAAASSTAVAILDLAVGTSTGFAPVPLATPSKLQLGQSVIRIGGTGADIVGEGVIASLPPKDNPFMLQASVSSATPGSVLITLFGEVIGIVTQNSLANGSDFYQTPSVPAATSTSATPSVPHS